MFPLITMDGNKVGEAGTKKTENVPTNVPTYIIEYLRVKPYGNKSNKKIPIEMIKYVYIVILGI